MSFYLAMVAHLLIYTFIKNSLLFAAIALTKGVLITEIYI